MKADELYQNMKRWATEAHARGETSAELYAQAEQERNGGFSISADYTRCLATFVKSLEQGRQI